MTRALLLGSLLVASLVACKSDGNNMAGDDTGGDDQPPIDAPDLPPGDWEQLLGRSWTIPPGSFDTYKCVKIQVPEDTWVAGFRAIAPKGTHHTVVTISNNANNLGEYDCSVSSLDTQMLYASGVATDDLIFPDGVGMKIKAGQYINLNLHLFNAGETDLSGTSGIMIKKIAQAAIVHEADMTFAGKLNFSIPPGDNQEIKGGCTLASDWNTFTLWPHMHQYAKHQKVVITPPGGSPMTLLDTDYSFEEQRNYPMANMTLVKGTKIEVTCKYNNDTNPAQNIAMGDSSNEEMCFTGMYKYPAGGNLFQCSSF